MLLVMPIEIRAAVDHLPPSRHRRRVAAVATAVLAAFTLAPSGSSADAGQADRTAWSSMAPAASLRAAPLGAARHLVLAGYADTAQRVVNAAALGITGDVLVAPAPTSELGRALANAHMTVIDARLSLELFYWECHRTHSVAPPPPEQANGYCATDVQPGATTAGVLQAIGDVVREDAANELVSGYWVLDDWPAWDAGSAALLLQDVRAVIEEVTPGYPAICGFGGEIRKAGETGGFRSGTAANYSNGGCSMIGLYNYALPEIGRAHV